MPLKDLAIWLGKQVGVTLTHMAKVEEYPAHALAKTAHSSTSQLGKHLHEMARTKDLLDHWKWQLVESTKLDSELSVITPTNQLSVTASPCQGTTCFLLQKHLGVFPTLTSDTFGILWTLTASEFQRHFRVLLFLSPFQQSPTLLHAPSTPTPHPTPPPKIAPRHPPPPKVAWRPLRTPYPLIQTPFRRSSETL